MNNETLLNANEVCKELNISSYTLANWYRWENKSLRSGELKKRYLPVPVIDYSKRGAPRYWNADMVNQLREYKQSIVVGRKGIYGKYTQKYYKKSVDKK